MSDSKIRYYVALVADNSSPDNCIKGCGLSPDAAVNYAWEREGFSEEQRPHVETIQDENGSDWHVVYGPSGLELARYSDEEDALDRYERVGFRAWECTERLYEALNDYLEAPYYYNGNILDLGSEEEDN